MYELMRMIAWDGIWKGSEHMQRGLAHVNQLLSGVEGSNHIFFH